MDTIATEKRARMLSRSMAKSGIGVGAAPSEDGDAINDEIAGANEPTTQSGQDREDKECFRQRCPCAIPTLPLLGRRRNASMAILAQRQTARQSEGRPITQPVVHILICNSPHRANNRNEN